MKTGLKALGSMVAAVALVFGMSACGGDKGTSAEAPEVVQPEEATEDEDVVEEEVVEEEVVPTDGIIAEYGVPFGTDLLTFVIVGTSQSNTGNPNYKVDITNNSDGQLMIKDGGFTVGGQETLANVNTTIAAGQTKSTYFSFSDKVVSSGADLVDVSGVIEVQSDFEPVEDFKVYFPNWEENAGE